MPKILHLLALGVLLVLAACSGAPSKMNPRDAALTEYAVAIRWSEFEDAMALIDPAVRLANPLTDLELERLKQIQVTGYEVKSRQPGADGAIEQTVEIRLINRNTQIERIIRDHQVWRFDAETKRFWLTTGLPDFSAR